MPWRGFRQRSAWCRLGSSGTFRLSWRPHDAIAGWMPTVLYLAGLLQATKIPRTPAELPRAKQTVDVLTLLRRERSWAGTVPASFGSVPNKPALQFDDQPAWAEFILLRLL